MPYQLIPIDSIWIAHHIPQRKRYSNLIRQTGFYINLAPPWTLALLHSFSKPPEYKWLSCTLPAKKKKKKTRLSICSKMNHGELVKAPTCDTLYSILRASPCWLRYISTKTPLSADTSFSAVSHSPGLFRSTTLAHQSTGLIVKGRASVVGRNRPKVGRSRKGCVGRHGSKGNETYVVNGQTWAASVR
jgi:hypothetical protein